MEEFAIRAVGWALGTTIRVWVVYVALSWLGVSVETDGITPFLAAAVMGTVGFIAAYEGPDGDEPTGDVAYDVGVHVIAHILAAALFLLFLAVVL